MSRQDVTPADEHGKRGSLRRCCYGRGARSSVESVALCGAKSSAKRGQDVPSKGEPCQEHPHEFINRCNGHTGERSSGSTHNTPNSRRRFNRTSGHSSSGDRGAQELHVIYITPPHRNEVQPPALNPENQWTGWLRLCRAETARIAPEISHACSCVQHHAATRTLKQNLQGMHAKTKLSASQGLMTHRQCKDGKQRAFRLLHGAPQPTTALRASGYTYASLKPRKTAPKAA